VKLTTYLYILPRIKMRGVAFPSPPNVFMVWYLINLRDNVYRLISVKTSEVQKFGRRHLQSDEKHLSTHV
jgi:hypothetical protein